MIRSTSSGRSATRRRRERVLDEPAQRDLRLERRPPRRSGATVASGIGYALGPPGVVHASTSRSTRSGCASASSCATIPPRLVPTTCARSTPASSSTGRASAAISAAEYGPGGASLSPIPRLSKQQHVEALGERLEQPAPSPSARSRARGSGAAARPRRAAPRRCCTSRRASSGSGSRPRAQPPQPRRRGSRARRARRRRAG